MASDSQLCSDSSDRSSTTGPKISSEVTPKAVRKKSRRQDVDARGVIDNGEDECGDSGGVLAKTRDDT